MRLKKSTAKATITELPVLKKVNKLTAPEPCKITTLEELQEAKIVAEKMLAGKTRTTRLAFKRTMRKEFGVLCCLTTPGLRKDIRRQIRQLYSHKVTYYVHYNYILSSHLLSHSRFYFYY